MRILVGLRLGVPGFPCLNPEEPGAKIFVFAPVLRFSKSNSTPSGVFGETGAPLGTNDVTAAIVGGFVEVGVEGEGANPPREADW